MRILTNTGVEVVDVFDRETASVIGTYWNDITRFLGTGDVSVLDPYLGVVVDGFELETDPDLIEDFDDEGQLDFRDIYER
jgi:hypothetical protein